MVTREEFERTIRAVDDGFKTNDVPIHQRPLLAVMEVLQHLKIQDTVPLTLSSVDPGDFSAASLPGQVNAWYQRLYGDRLKVHPGPGSVLVGIRGEAWEMKLPLVYGSISFVCEPSMLGNRHPRMCNVLNLIEKIPAGLAATLDDDERIGLLRACVDSMDTLEAVRSEHDAPYVTEALGDFAGSVRFLIDLNRHGLSKWSSLQFAEKLMKSRLKRAGATFSKDHNLKALAEGVSKLSMNVENGDIQTIQCPAGVRYGDVDVARVDAVAAHHAALRLARCLGFRGAVKGSGPLPPAR